MPFTIHPNFPYKTKVLNAIIKMNKDLGCLKVHYIDYEDYDKNNPRSNPFLKFKVCHNMRLYYNDFL